MRTTEERTRLSRERTAEVKRGEQGRKEPDADAVRGREAGQEVQAE